MKNTHRVILEHMETGQCKIMFRGTRGEALAYWSEWQTNAKMKHNPGDTAKYVRPGWVMYIAGIEEDSMLHGAERKYKVLGIEVESNEARASARREVMAQVHSAHPLVNHWKKLFSTNLGLAIRNARDQVMECWEEHDGKLSVAECIEQVLSDEEAMVND